MQDVGRRIPGIRIRENYDMPSDTYLIVINEIPVEMGSVDPEGIFLPESAPGDERLRPHAPRIGRRARPGAPSGKWITAEEMRRATTTGATHMTPLHYIVAHLEEIVRRNLSLFLALDDARTLLQQWEDAGLTDSQAKFALHLRTDYAALTAAVRVLRALVDEGVPLVTPGPLLEGLRLAGAVANPVDAAERVRRPLRRQLPGNALGWHHLRLSDNLEKRLVDGLSSINGIVGLTLSPEDLWEVQTALRTTLDAAQQDARAIVVATSELRPYLLHLLAEEWPAIPVLARDELIPSLRGRYRDLPVISLD
jgi:flagellar biosynthesis protein FlhA